MIHAFVNWSSNTQSTHLNRLDINNFNIVERMKTFFYFLFPHFLPLGMIRTILFCYVHFSLFQFISCLVVWSLLKSKYCSARGCLHLIVIHLRSNGIKLDFCCHAIRSKSVERIVLYN